MEYLSLYAAQKCVLQHVKLSGVETVRLEQALGRVLAQQVRANRDQPPYDVSAMDGYAVRNVDLAQIPAVLEIIDDIKAGDMPIKTVQRGQCARIMTGAPVPKGADTVIRVEDTQTSETNKVQIEYAVPSGSNIRLQGEGMRNGDVVLNAGTEITPGVIGVLATVKAAQMQVYRRPRVAILSTGDELEGMDEPLDPNKIPNSNSYALMAQLQAMGIEPALLGIARDDPEELAQYLRRGLEYDVLLVSGGSSVGVHDFVRPTLEALGVTMHFWRVEIRPGHPIAFGVKQQNVESEPKVAEVDVVQGARSTATQAYQVDRQGSEHRATRQCAASTTFVFGLPGNPVSSMVCFEQFVLPALRSMTGHARLYRRTIEARLTQTLKAKPGRTEFVRVMLSRDVNGYVATPTGTQSSGVLLSMARADGLMVVPADSTGIAAGEQVVVQLLDGTAFQDEVGFRE
ncbi:MAG TPA: molybdopterin molybdotransferase MoeA [Gallionella sp.]|nr:molybdopterin molybdotransferase MoeA [Gallionella sp.]